MKVNNILRRIMYIVLTISGLIYSVGYIIDEITFLEFKGYNKQIQNAYLGHSISRESYDEMMNVLHTTGYASESEFNEDMKSYKNMYD